MAGKRKNRKSRKKKKNRFLLKMILGLLLVSIFSIFIFNRKKISLYYSLFFETRQYKTLKNTPFETLRMNKIIGRYADKTFGIDISHYQNKKDIFWDSLYIAEGLIPLEFVVMRATMGNNAKDKNFDFFWKKAKEHELIRGAYHFYRPDENPVSQANSYLKSVNLSKGDLRPVLDIEKLPSKKSKDRYFKDIQIWLDIVERRYGKKPIIYTYYHFYKDHLRGRFDDYPLWLANYNDVASPSPSDYWKIWQFTENGISSGSNTKIDLNIYNGTKQEMRELLLD